MSASSGNRFFDDVTRFFGDAAGAAQGMRREMETMVKAQIERFLRDMDVATREELAVLRDQVDDLRRDNEALRSRVAALDGTPAETGTPGQKRARAAKAPVTASEPASSGTDAPAGNTL